MKKIFLVFIIFSLLVLVGCKSNNIENNENTFEDKSKIVNNSSECKSNMKLWINKTYNFEVCIPNDYLGFDAYGHSILFNRELKTFTVTDKNGNLYVMNDDISIGRLGDDNKMYIGLCSEENKQNNVNIYSVKLRNGKKVCFLFDKQTEEIKDIINSIKLLKTF